MEAEACAGADVGVLEAVVNVIGAEGEVARPEVEVAIGATRTEIEDYSEAAKPSLLGLKSTKSLHSGWRATHKLSSNRFKLSPKTHEEVVYTTSLMLSSLSGFIGGAKR